MGEIKWEIEIDIYIVPTCVKQVASGNWYNAGGSAWCSVMT